MSTVSLDAIDGGLLTQEIDALATISEHPAPAVTRVLFSKEDMAARAWFQAKCEEAGLFMRADPAGNMFARWEGSNPSLAAVATGSHADAIPGAGKYDGVVGVLGAVMTAFGVIFLALLITVWLWDSHPLLALGVFTALFLGGGIVALLTAQGKLRGLVEMFGATRDELRRDQQRLRGDAP